VREGYSEAIGALLFGLCTGFWSKDVLLRAGGGNIEEPC